jgi:hypothetical protein
MSLRMLTNLRLADLRLAIAQQRTTGQNLPSDLYLCVTTRMCEHRGREVRHERVPQELMLTYSKQNRFHFM